MNLSGWDIFKAGFWFALGMILAQSLASFTGELVFRLLGPG